MEEQVAKDYANFIKLDLKTEVQSVEETVDDMLTRLDELENFLTMVRADGALCANVALPKVLECKPQLDELFNRIDKLGAFVSRVEADVSKVETAVIQAEADLASSNPSILKTFLKPLFFKNTPDTSSKKTPRQTPTCDIDSLYNTEDFFPAQKTSCCSNPLRPARIGNDGKKSKVNVIGAITLTRL